MAVQLVTLLENYLADIERCEADVNNEDNGDGGGDGCRSTELADGSADVGAVEGPDATEDQVYIVDKAR